MADEALIERFRAGDADAVRELYREYGGAVMTVARSIVRDTDLAADVVQQTFVKAWRAAATFDGSGTVAAWLYSIARRASIDALRAEVKPTRGDHDREVEIADTGATFERTWIQFEVRQAIDALPSDEREVIRRSHLLGETHAQIADAMNVPIGTVKSRASRAFKRLARSLVHLDANQIDVGDVVDGEEDA